ncbi:MAG: glycosyl transferase family 9 [Magnetococcales bacterium]|nr:glycosyl transferase family 9 [Magnetococcales bacterium]
MDRTIQKDLEIAIGHHTQGRLREAEALYKKIVHSDPRQPDALHLLGVIAHQSGHTDLAITLMGQAIAVKPDFAEAHGNLGLIFSGLERWQEAQRHFYQATRYKPDFAEAYFHCGNALVELGQWDAAVAEYRKAVEILPQWGDAYYNMGNTWVTLGNLQEAEVCYGRAVGVNPDLAAAHFNRGHALETLGRFEESLASFHRGLEIEPENAGGFCGVGNVLIELGRLDEAVAAYTHATALNPGYADAFYNLGRVLVMRGDLELALVHYQTALTLRPGFAPACYNLGNALVELGRLDEAEGCYRQAIAARSDYAEAWYNLGNTFRELGRLDAAMEAYGQALLSRPGFAEAYFGMGVIWLLRGDFVQGWPLYEWRWKKRDFPPHEHHQPLWDGGPMAGGTLLLHCEQGFGDSIQFVRFLPLVKEKSAARTVLFCPQPLHRLFTTMAGIDHWVTSWEQIPPSDYQVPLLSLPYVLGSRTTFATAGLPYLAPDSQGVARFRESLAKLQGFKVGIAWRGSPAHKNDRRRSMDPRFLVPLFDIDDCHFIGLQKGAPKADQDFLLERGNYSDWSGMLDDFADTAALMAHLDLVIAVDTSVIHLAGALGRPAWLLLPYVPDWRWLLDGDESPWYPSVHLFRQSLRGDWEGVIRDCVCRLGEAVVGTQKVASVFLQRNKP